MFTAIATVLIILALNKFHSDENARRNLIRAELKRQGKI